MTDQQTPETQELLDEEPISLEQLRPLTQDEISTKIMYYRTQVFEGKKLSLTTYQNAQRYLQMLRARSVTSNSRASKEAKAKVEHIVEPVEALDLNSLLGD